MENFCKGDWTGRIALIRFNKFPCARTGRGSPAAVFQQPGMTFRVPSMEPNAWLCFVPAGGIADSIRRPPVGETAMSLGMILIIILIIFLLGGFSGRFGGYGYGMGHSGMGLGGVILIVLIILMLLGRL